MKKNSNIKIFIVFLIFCALASFQGNRVEKLREAEASYRWIMSEANQIAVFGAIQIDEDPDAPKLQDQDFYAKVEQELERLLPDPQSISDTEKADEGKVISKVVRITKASQGDFATNDDHILWNTILSKQMEPLRKEYSVLTSKNQLTPVGSVFSAKDAYSRSGANINIGNIFLGFRKLAANFVWMQVDKFWHQGMLHRMVPLMKTTVTLDPNFVDAYLLGAWHLAYNATAKMPDTPEPLKKYNKRYKVRVGEKETYYYMAVEFLKDGIKHNFRNYKLYFDLGLGVYKLKPKDYPNAVKYLSQAMRHRHDRWVPRQLYICMEANGQYEEALAGWKKYYEQFPDNINAPRFIKRNEGHIKEQLAKKTTDPIEKEQYLNQAKEIWKSMGEDDFARGRLFRLEAVKLLAQKRYLEAIAILENARWVSAEFFEEASQMIIDAKLASGMSLSVSEKKAVMRQQEAEKYKNLPPEE